MFEERESRGQVGIGTLIVFIAMVLVAAIAAGVLINTAGFLQTQAEDTGTESSAQVANNLLVLSDVGTVNDSGGNLTIDTLKLTVQKSAGADQINLERLTIHYLGPAGDEHLIFTDSDDVDDPTQESVYDLNTVSDDADDNLLVRASDRYEIVIDLDQAGGGDLANLEEGQSASLRITTADGAQKYLTVSVPDSLAGWEDGGVVDL